MIDAVTPTIQLLDQVVSEFEADRIGSGVLVLTGILDALVRDPTRIEAVRRMVLAHPVGEFLAAGQPLARTIAESRPRLEWLAAPALAEVGSRCGREMSEAVRGLAFARGLQDRRQLGSSVLARNWQRGSRIALIDCGELGELDVLNGAALDNLRLLHREADIAMMLRRDLGLQPPGDAETFDILLASSVADYRDEAALSAWLTAQADQLAPDGTLFLSSFVPGHLGFGWQSVCLRRDLFCHDAAALERCAHASGFAIRHMLNASGSLIWAELVRRTGDHPARTHNTTLGDHHA